MTTHLPLLNTARLWQRVETLSAFTRPDMPWTRRAFSPQFDAARTWLHQQFVDAGLTTHLDVGGNLVGRLAGRDGHITKPLVTGSHSDTVMLGGRFDGIIGVLAGVEVAHTLHEHGIALAHPVEVIDFLSEEPSDYGISCVGSRAITGQLSATMLAAINPEGETLACAMRRVGADPSALGRVLRAPGSVAAFVELHIEQGPVLETHGVPIGVVTHIVGIQGVSIVVEGQPDHAGTTPMALRRDALVGAARIIDTVYRHAHAMDKKPHDVVATVGRLTLAPNASNTVPGRVEMEMQVRSSHASVLDHFPDAVMALVAQDLKSLRVTATMTPLRRSEPTACTEQVMAVIERAATRLGYPTIRMPSGAGHDAMIMAMTGPMGMIFVPCRDGRSHCPEEWIEPQQLFDGAHVLYHTLCALDQELCACA